MRRLLALALVAMIASACFGGSTEASRQASPGAPRIQPADLQVDVTLVPPCVTAGDQLCIARDFTRHYTLRCNPAGGSMPSPVSACRALADVEWRMHGHGWRTSVCMGGPEVASTATLHGTVGGRTFTLALDAAGSWCRQPRAVMRDLWILSRFPCSYPVLHIGGGTWPTPQAWARHNGCPAGNVLAPILTTGG